MRGVLELTDSQARTLAACGLCHTPLDWRRVKPALESGDVHPPDIYCRRCGIRARAGIPADVAMSAALTVLARIEAAGLTGYYEGVAADAGYPPRETAA
ncbi:MAG: hypothetical protein M3522_07160 [Actinomycetota bacterium]|nr:hypothetical protein [Actinomycetota bacterium]